MAEVVLGLDVGTPAGGDGLVLLPYLVDRERPVTCVHATGGAFHASLWRTAVAAAVGRPVVFGDAAEGCALGAAALGLLAVGRAAAPADTRAALVPAEETRAVVAADRDVAVSDRLRRDLSGLVHALSRATGLIAAG